MNPKFKAVSELECRNERAKEILKFIMERNAEEGINDQDLRRVYKALEGVRYAKMYRRRHGGLDQRRQTESVEENQNTVK